jgi:hypothetical protein
MDFTGAFEGPVAGAGAEQLPDFTVYRGPEGSGVSLVGLATTGEPEAGGPGVETVVRGGREYLVEPTSAGETISWSEGERVPTLIGRGLTRDELLTAAQATTVDGSGRIEVAPDALPADVTKVGVVPYGVATPMANAIATLDGSGGIGYADADQSRVLEVTWAIADHGWLEASEALLDEPRPLEVRGQPAIAGELGQGTTGNTLVWVEPDGTFVRLVGFALTVDQLLEIAESLEPLTPEQWQEMLDESDRRSGDTAADSSSGTAVESATTFEGVGEELPLLMFDPVAGEPTRAVLQISTVPDTELVVDATMARDLPHRVYDGRWLYGVVPADTALVEVSGTSGGASTTSFFHVSGPESRDMMAYLLEVPGLGRAYTITAHLEDGSTVVAQS